MTPHQGPPTSRSTAPFNVGSHQPQQQHRATSATSLWIPTCFPEDPVGPPQAPVSAHCQLQEDANRGRWPLSATAVEGPPPLLPPSDWGWPAASSQRSSKQYSPSSQTRPPSMSAGQTQPASALPVLESAPFAGRDHLYAHKQSNLSYLMSQPSSSLPPAPPAEQRWSSLVASAEATIPPPPSGDLRPRSSSTSTTESSSSQNSSQSGDLFDDLDPTPKAHPPDPSVTPFRTSEAFQRASQDAIVSKKHRPTPSTSGSMTAHPQATDYRGQIEPWMQANGLYPSSQPSASSLTIPEFEVGPQVPDNQLWGQFSNLHFQRDGSNLTSPASSFSDISGDMPPVPQAALDGLDESAGPRSRRRKSMNQPEITNDPLYWRSQTTRATKQASIARRKPGSVARFACPYCSECFTRKYNLNGHVRAHKGERPFECDQPGCVKAFSRQHDLKRHRELHATSEQFRCASCFKGFRKIDALQRHYRSEPSCIDPYPQLDFNAFPDLYLSDAVLSATGPASAPLPPSPHSAQFTSATLHSEMPGMLPQHQQMPVSASSFESLNSAYF